MVRVVVFAYGAVSYAIFFLTFLYTAGFVGNMLVPRSIDSGPTVALQTALVVNVLLLAIFSVQHSVMARPAFKRWLTRFIPEAAERSTYVLLSSAALILLFWLWRPLGGVVWDVQNPIAWWALQGLFACGWLTILVTTFLINHFDLFGLRQVWLFLRGQEYTYLEFKTPGPYRFVRHPLYVGWLIAFWATPTMSVGHLLFSALITVYILVAIQFEERDLVEFHPEYVDYRRRVPMLLPGTKRK
ncbi:MAG: isoprenylcysteine carboxylmethyltransferase family protein [Pirellulaceae bacterium]|jgi:protein-S-isoprenylcysteine O-methyltransferase Ste14|nr:isoprenylcysteine carboxylmethyltransferase family protein [Pirellulaceae bacterium]MDP7014174.1 isoprenylcysteine carboxylmethyltransferase family protein [Pirellulaceae bacterium]